MRRTLTATTMAVVVMAGLAVQAASIDWGGGAAGTWSTGANWVGGLVPTNGDDATFSDATVDRTTTLDVQGRTFHATTGANLPVGDTIPDANAQTYMLLADLPVIHFAYTNMEAFGSGLGTLIANRWRGDPNDGFRNVTTGADFADFAAKYQVRDGSHLNYNADNVSKTEFDVPTPQAAFDLPDVDDTYGAASPKLYVAHDTDTARPTWLSGSFTDTGKDLATGGEDPTWDVFETDLTTLSAPVGDSRGWISDGGSLASLTVNQSTVGVTQTINLAHDVTVTGAPTFNVTAGAAVIDIGSYTLRTTGAITIGNGATMLLDGGEIGRVEGDASSGGLAIGSGGRLSGTGFLNPGRGDLSIADGGTLEVGTGTLAFNFPYGNSLVWNGAIVGDGTNSVLNLGAGLFNGQLKGITQPGANASISGIVELQMYPNYANLTFGRFADASLVQTGDMTLSSWSSQPFNWEAQAISEDVAGTSGNPAFELGAWEPHAGADLLLVDSGSNPDDFVYIGQLVGLNSGQRIDLGGNALLTDMTPAELTAVLGFIDNTGGLGVPTVKSVQLGWENWFSYIAPADVTIAQVIPEPATCAVLALGLLAALWRRK